MRLAYCDRCGVEHREGSGGGRVVTVSFHPMQRTVDLCGDCRADFMPVLNAFTTGRIADKIASPTQEAP